MRAGTLETAMATMLLQVGQCYKSDLLLYGRQLNGSDAVMPTKALKKMIEEKTVAIRKIQRKGEKDKFKDAVALTRRGKVTVLDVIDEKYHYDHYRKYGADFHTSSPATLRTRLLDSRIKIMFSAAGIPVFGSEKPSLSRLIKENGRGSVTIDDQIESEYIQLKNREEYEAFLKNGVYYSIKELRQFLDEQAPGTSDTTYRSRVRGVFISRDKCVMIYISPVGDNKIMRLSTEGERNLIRRMKEVLSVTNVERQMIELTRKDINPDGTYHLFEDIRKGSVSALMITDTDAMVYAMATGNRNGIIRGTDAEQLQENRKRAAEKKNKNTKYVWLTGNRQLYKRIFVTPFTYNGTVCLSYLCHTTAEEWAATSANLIEKTDKFTRSTFNPMYPGTIEENENQIPIIFMPVYEVTELADIAKQKGSVCVITYEDMANAISHSARKELRFFDAETMKLIDRDSVMIYDQNGYEKGAKIIEKELARLGKKCSKKEIKDTAIALDMSYTKLCNHVARNSIPVDEVIEKMKLEEMADVNYRKSESVKTKATSVTVMVSDEFAKKIKQAAKLHGINVSAYIKGLIADTVKEDSLKYTEQIKKERELWNT